MPSRLVSRTASLPDVAATHAWKRRSKPVVGRICKAYQLGGSKPSVVSTALGCPTRIREARCQGRHEREGDPDEAGRGRRAPAESVWGYPRPPLADPDERHVVIRHAGVVLAESRRCIRVLETSHPPVFCLPRQDIRTDLLTPPSPRRTRCE
ncbi:DUF427 domain-containing protein [Streptomyces sp. NPDC007863]|uniref:DUF427 domain-containing protein n=1 Tax=Streptomyces sp. NPDC007863 TaxID=3154894 RepID=UPI0034007AAF